MPKTPIIAFNNPSIGSSIKPHTIVAIGRAIPIGNKYNDLIILINFVFLIRRSAKPREREICSGFIIIVSNDVIFNDCQKRGSLKRY